MSNSMTDVESTFSRGLSKTNRDILKDQQQNQLEELKSMRETLDNFMKNEKRSEQAGKTTKNDSIVKMLLISCLKIFIVAFIMTAIVLIIIFGLSNISIQI
jgi:hypothetical protein